MFTSYLTVLWVKPLGSLGHDDSPMDGMGHPIETDKANVGATPVSFVARM